MKKIALIAAAGSLALTLSACGGNKTDEAPVETNVSNLEVEVDNSMPGNEVATPAPETNANHAPAAAGAEFTNGAQTQDDADATGMTARVSRDEDNQTAPTH